MSSRPRDIEVPPSTGGMPRRTSQLLYDSRSPDGLSNAVVLYDYDQHALVAKETTSSGTPLAATAAGALLLSPTQRFSNRCPMCNSLLSDVFETSDNASYFPTLAYWHRRYAMVSNHPSAVTSPSNQSPTTNPFSASPATHSEAATSALKDIDPSLLVNGYYGRFFQEVRRLGSGSFGSVFLCNHVIDDVLLGEFAIKKIPVGDSREWLRGMMKEVKALERLATHRNIVSYKHSWLEMHRANELCPYVPYLFILMSFCDGGSLDLLTTTSGLPDSTIWSLLIDITSGLQHLHRNYIIHRDLKDANILLTRDSNSVGGYRAVLSDFGTVEIVGSESSRDHSGFTGTVEFTAPEVLSSQHMYTEKSDMWSLGIVLYAMCYGCVPYTDRDPVACAAFVTSHSEISIPISPARDENLKNIISALTAKDPQSRPSCDDILFHPFIRSKMIDRTS